MSLGKPQRLDDILFSQGFGTRRVCAGLLRAGLVRLVDPAQGNPVLTDPASLHQPTGLVLEVEGEPWPVHEHTLVLLHKPAGYECSTKPSSWPSVLLLLPAALRRRVQTVGRLDQDTTGLLLLTDDGHLIHRLNSPKHHVPKVYQVQTARPVDEKQARQLREGVVLDDDPQPVHAEACEITGPQSLKLTLVQGKYHQVKRMVAAVGNHCESLHRSDYGTLNLDAGPALGLWRWVGDAERGALLAG